MHGCIPFTIYYYIFKFHQRDCRSEYALHRQNTENHDDAIAKVGNKYRRDTTVIADTNDIPLRWFEKGTSIIVPGQPVAGMRADCVTVID